MVHIKIKILSIVCYWAFHKDSKYDRVEKKTFLLNVNMQPAERNLVIWPLGFNNPNKFLFAAQNPNI